MLMGGHNAEHDVSMQTGTALAKALRTRGYEVIDIIVDDQLAQQLVKEKIDVAFIALHGRWGEDGCVQGLLECMRIPYTGSSVLASAMAMDKVCAKKMFRESGLPVIEDLVISRKSNDSADYQDIEVPFDYPVIVKPAREGSSVGIGLVKSKNDLAEAVKNAAGYAGDILIERFVAGREINVAIMDEKALGAVEVIPAEEFYTYKAKYQSGGTTQYLSPAPLSPEETQTVFDLSLKAHQALGCSGASRVESILAEDGRFYLLEVNTIPGMTDSSLVPKIAASVGISFEEFTEKLLLGASLKA
jgi:D-alanine-D-alanine ligase